MSVLPLRLAWIAAVAMLWLVACDQAVAPDHELDSTGASSPASTPLAQPASSVDAPSLEAGTAGGMRSTSPGAPAAAAPAPAPVREPAPLSTPAATSRRMPCGVADTVTRYCGDCHVGSHVHGPSLASAADFRAPSAAGPLYQVAKKKLNATDPHQTMPPAGYPRPPAEELRALNAWLDQAAPDSNESCSAPLAPTAREPESTEGLTCYPLRAHSGDLKTPYKVGVARDAYINFTFTPPWKSGEYGVLIRALIEHPENVHHALLYEEIKPGTPGPAPSSQVHPDSLLIGNWLPGNPNLDLRTFADDDVALELRTDTTYTVELHYNSQDPNLSDSSGLEVCARKDKPKNLASYSWVGMDNFLFASEKWVATCKPTATEPIRLLSVLPHMHLKGIHFKATLNRNDGSKLVFHDQPFDFRFERQYPVNLTLYPGESITTECTYSEPKSYGPNVEDEMCTLFTLHYPKGTLVDDGLWSLLHGGGACLGGG